MGNCIQPPSGDRSKYDKLEADEFNLMMENERNAFNTVNRNLNLNQIKPLVNEAALQFLKANGNPSSSSTAHEASARRVFIRMVTAKAAYMASVEFDSAVRIRRGLMPNRAD